MVTTDLITTGEPKQEMDWSAFTDALKTALAVTVPKEGQGATGSAWNPLQKKFSPWIDLKKLAAVYNVGGAGAGSSLVCNVS